MIVRNILEDINIVRKNNIKDYFSTFARSSEISCIGVSCFDIIGNEFFKSKFDLAGFRYLLIYLFHNLNDEKLTVVGCPLLYSQTMFSFSDTWASLYYYEKEISKNFAIKFYLNERIQNEIVEKTTPAFMDKDFSGKEINLQELPFINSDYDFLSVSLDEFGVSEDKTTFEFLVSGRNIHQFQLSKQSVSLGLEKKFENLKLDDVSKYISHINVSTPFTYQILWKEIVLYIKKSQKNIYSSAKLMLLKEIASITEHLNSLINCFSILNENNSNEICKNIKYDLIQLLRKLDDSRPYPIVTNGYDDCFPRGWMRDCIALAQREEGKLIKLKESITSMDRCIRELNKGPMITNPLKMGLSGLMLRSFGVSYDIRKKQPFYFYDQLDLKVPLGVVGSTYDRILIRLEEALESFSNIIRILEGFPVYKEQDHNETDKLHGDEEIIIASTESANGEIVMLLHYDFKKSKINRLNIMTPTTRFLKSFESLYTVADLDLISVDWASYGLNISEVLK